MAADERGNALPAPSFCYRAVLDLARTNYDGARLYLAPANKFGGEVAEQQAAADYLAGWRGEVVVPPAVDGAYIDTRGNARHLRAYCEARNLMPREPVTLLAGARHIRRAALNFRREGFVVGAAVGARYVVDDDAHMPRRLFYYKHPILHIAYEALALTRDLIRF